MALQATWSLCRSTPMDIGLQPIDWQNSPSPGTEIEPESRPTVSHPTGEQHWNTVPSKAPWKPPLQSTTGAIRTPGYPTGVPGRDGWENKTTIEDTFSIKDTYNVQALPAILLLSQNVILVELLILKTIALHQTCQTWKWHNVFKARYLKWNTQAHLFSPSLNPKSLKQAALLFKVQWVETLLVSWLCKPHGACVGRHLWI